MNTPYTEQQKRQFQDEFRTRRSRQMMVSLPMMALVLGAALLHDKKTDTIAGFSSAIFGGTMLVLVLGVLAFSFKNWRCPACNSYLGRSLSPRFCPKCGAQLGG